MKYRVSLIIIDHCGNQYKISRILEYDTPDLVYSALRMIAKKFLSYIRSQSSISFVDDEGRIVYIRDTSNTTAMISFGKLFSEHEKPESYVHLEPDEIKAIYGEHEPISVDLFRG